jgi:hypothetical protein
MNHLNASIANIPIPERMRHLRISDTGFPVPWFVATIANQPDFRVADGRKFRRAIDADLCWLCGNTLGRFKVFVIGPMCAVNRTTAEPPCHRECAEYAVAACPFLTRPRMRRNEQDLPDGHAEPGGIMIRRNPGCTLLWITHDYRLMRVDNGRGVIIKIGEPVEIVAYAEGRRATRNELDASITSGLPLLAAECDGEEGRIALAQQVERTNQLFRQKLAVWGSP